MKKLIFSAVLLISFSTSFAQDQADYDNLKQEVKELHARIDSLESRVAQNTLLTLLASGGDDSNSEAMLMWMALMASSDSNTQTADQGDSQTSYGNTGGGGGKQESSIPYVTEKEALAYIKDHYSFYNTDYVYKDVQLRRSKDNEFTVSIQEKMKDTYSWRGYVKTLVVFSNGEYRFTGGY